MAYCHQCCSTSGHMQKQVYVMRYISDTLAIYSIDNPPDHLRLFCSQWRWVDVFKFLGAPLEGYLPKGVRETAWKSPKQLFLFLVITPLEKRLDIVEPALLTMMWIFSWKIRLGSVWSDFSEGIRGLCLYVRTPTMRVSIVKLECIALVPLITWSLISHLPM